MTDKRYNGWVNYETWLTNLHFDDYFIEQAKEYYDEAEADETFTRLENATHALADNIKSTIEEYVDDVLGNITGLVSDFVRAGLSEVNYCEIAKNYLSEYASNLTDES